MGARVLGVIIVLFALIILLFIFQTQIAGLAQPVRLSSPSSSVRTGPALPPPSGTTPTRTSTVPLPTPPAGFAQKDLSPHYGKITINSVSRSYSASQYSSVALRAGNLGGTTLNITNWRIQGNRGSTYIPRAVSLYSPSGLAPEGDIYVQSGHAVTLYSTVSALGKNVRINKCMGYLENTIDFNPRLPLSCPNDRPANFTSLTGACQDYIRSLSGCRVPANNPPLSIYDDACRAYLNTINYGGCYDRHVGDKDFLSNQWVIWTGGKFLDERHDRVLLYDANSLIVDEYIY